MESLLARKPRLLLLVEPLEDRRMLSFFGLSPTWDDQARRTELAAETAPMRGGPAIPMDDPFEVVVADSGPFAGYGTTSIGSPETPGQTENVAAGCDSSMAVVGDSNPGVSAESVPAPSPKPSATEGDQANSPDIEQAARTSVSPVIVNPPGSFTMGSPPKAAPTFSVARSAGEPVSTSARVEVSSNPSASGRSGLQETFLVNTSASSPPSEYAISPEPARVSLGSFSPPGSGLFIGQGSSLLALSPSKGSVDPSITPEIPIGQEGIEGAAAGSEVRVENVPARSIEFGMPEPRLAGLIQNFLPFDRGALEAAIDRCLEPFDGLASSMPELRGPMGWLSASLAAATTVVAVEVALRIRRAREQEQGTGEIAELAIRPES